jgi:hypothetical protein
MGTYSDFQKEAAYTSKQSGSGLEVVLFDETNPSAIIVGAVTNYNFTDDFEVIPIEEAGNEGVDEIVQGRHSGNGTIQNFFSPNWNDGLLTRQSFIGRGFTIHVRIAPERPGAGCVVDAFTGVKISRVGASHGARGARTMDLAFSYERRYNGAEWASLATT